LTLQLRARLRERREGPVGAALAAASIDEQYDAWVSRYDTLTEIDVRDIRRRGRRIRQPPRVCIATAATGAPPDAFARSLASVSAQAFERWQLIVATDRAATPRIKALVAGDRRTSVVEVEETTTAGALGRAVAAGECDYLTVLWPGATLRPHALAVFVAAIVRDRGSARVLYADEDTLSHDGTRLAPVFKPDWNRALLLGTPYVGDVLVCEHALVEEVGGLRPAFGRASIWDLALRLAERVDPARIRHLPYVLHHTDDVAVDRPAFAAAGRRAVDDHFRRTGLPGAVTRVTATGNRLRFDLPEQLPRVHVVIPTGFRHEAVGRCFSSLLTRTEYANFVVTVLTDDANRARAEAEPSLDDPRVRVLTYPKRRFNYARTINEGVASQATEIVCLLNDDVEIIGGGWLGALVARTSLPRIGAVGAMLYYPDGTVQHGGIILGAGRVAAHYQTGLPRGDPGYCGRAALDQELSAVTAACMVLRREAFDEVGGFDEAFEVAFNDVDFCLKLRRAGWRIVWTPDAELYHLESVSVGGIHSPQRREQFLDEIARMEDRWGRAVREDPFYNPNLSLGRLNTLAFPPRVDVLAELPGAFPRTRGARRARPGGRPRA